MSSTETFEGFRDGTRVRITLPSLPAVTVPGSLPLRKRFGPVVEAVFYNAALPADRQCGPSGAFYVRQVPIPQRDLIDAQIELL